ncbi:muscle M-line assembly protein unc-89 [Sitodiplosis mosellana]|uniref:muscle M-line assembly protein unc-89 n=1 Tax=Sitodiplosis mosellana TaxID=263140 RepID=UPI00244478CD|nr:muscle M-line assembly protein unc-89 [Sitodiplosis mosellana]XP_055302798.1 muscle M-line assembly protein unc-89 [Sitodiplosis mosellana]XP_055302799.1 muscle M-line assembly protein unc-89 [Sitodiplosis mosellana]
MNGNGMKASTSQRSVYEYPEHLNPFYEDENHKRLRFWKIGSNKPNRSNSFSIDGLKGLWSFKTFKLKKKSSTLGVNKTSESPPMLRGDKDRYGSQTTFDGRLRHTVDIGLGNDFQRGAPCRSSLQDLNSTSRYQGENNFIRNNRYRSTMQAGSSTHSNAAIGAVTPVFRSRYNQQSISRGSSQLSVNSSNPFDDDYETISQVGSPERSSIRHSARKKRRAPPPPVSPNKAELKVEAEQVNITNLTAEIESFVRIADTDEEKIESKSEQTDSITLKTDERDNNEKTEIKDEEHDKGKTSRQSPESNDFYPQLQDEHCEEITIEKIQNLGATDINSNERSKRSPVKILIRAPTDEEPLSVTIDDEYEKTMQPESDEYGSKDTEREIVVVEKECVLKESANEESTQIDAENDDPKEYLETMKVIQDTEGATTPTSSAVEFILENENMADKGDTTLLKITESSDDLTKDDTDNSDPNDKQEIESMTKEKMTVLERQCEHVNQTFSRYEVRSIPLKLDSPKIRKKDVGAKKEPPTPPQRRRSVKEIIESINKCQSLLKINQDLKTEKAEKDKMNTDLFQASHSSSSKSFNSKPSFNDRNMNDSVEKPYQNKKMFSDIAEVNNNVKNEDMSNIPLFVEKFNEFNNNNPNSIFEKCVLRGKNTDKKVEWNPVPKPRRHRNSTQGSIN